MSVDAFVAACPEPQRGVLSALRALVREAAPDLAETIKWGKPCYGRGKTTLFALVPHRAHVNLQVFAGAALPDPDGLLEGTGTSMRHVKCRSVEDARRPALRDLVATAARG
jgi:hypothetical protein